MRKWIMAGVCITLVLMFAITALGIYFGFFLPRTAPPLRSNVKITPERLSRGRYIFEVVSNCGDCHSRRDFSRFGGPVVSGGVGVGQVMPLPELPGTIVASNLTPDLETGLGTWTDGEKIRAIREGISKDGRALFPLMPYGDYRSMSDFDVESLVAYMNLLPPVRNTLPETRIAFPVSLLIRSEPRPVGSVQAPAREATAKYGEYLVNIGGCRGCHTPGEGGRSNESMAFAGGRVFRTPMGSVVSANITPDTETGIGSWTEDYFKQRFTTQRVYIHTGAPKIGPDRFTLMPWLGLSQMQDLDLSAIYKFLFKQPAVRNKVQPHAATS